MGGSLFENYLLGWLSNLLDAGLPYSPNNLNDFTIFSPELSRDKDYWDDYSFVIIFLYSPRIWLADILSLFLIDFDFFFLVYAT